MKRQHPVTVVSLLLLLGLSGLTLHAGAQVSSSSNNDAMLLLLEQNRNLQAEVQALRALVEEQGFQIRRLQRESLDRYTDVDSRLSNLEQASAGGAGTAGGSASITPPAVSPAETDTRLPPAIDREPDVQDDVTRAPGIADNANQPPSRGTPATRPGSATARTGTSRPSLEPAVLSEQQLYQMAYDSAINSQFERAIAEFDQYLSIYPAGRFTTNSHYWKGQSFLYLSRYDEAIAEYSIILDQHPEDAKVPDAMYGQAIAYEGMGNLPRARQLLQSIIRDYPNTGVANLADTRLRSLN